MHDELLISILVANDPLQRADAIVLLTSENFQERSAQAAHLLSENWAEMIVVSGVYKSVHPEDRFLPLWRSGVPHERIMDEPASCNTREQGVNMMRLVKDNRWSSLILVASHFHQLRAFLTFLRAMQEAELSLKIYNAPACNIAWFAGTPSRAELLEDELRKIRAYGPHVATYDEGLAYLRTRDST